MVTIVGLQFSIAVQWEVVMSVADWRSEQDYAKLDKAEIDAFAWEYLRRDNEYEQEFRNLKAAEQPIEAPHQFRQKWGLSFRGRS